MLIKYVLVVLIMSAVDCCENRFKLDFSKMELPEIHANFDDCKLWWSALCILFNPLYWNLVARLEYKTKFLSRLCCSSKLGCCLLAFSIIVLGIYRDMRFYDAMVAQPRWLLLQQNAILWSGHLLVVTGSFLVLSSFWVLGFYGTFLGDYFGILLPAKVEGFPFTLTNNPMYWGSTMNFLGMALVNCSQTGIMLSVLVAVVYRVAISCEESFTNSIYAKKATIEHDNDMLRTVHKEKSE